MKLSYSVMSVIFLFFGSHMLFGMKNPYTPVPGTNNEDVMQLLFSGEDVLLGTFPVDGVVTQVFMKLLNTPHDIYISSQDKLTEKHIRDLLQYFVVTVKREGGQQGVFNMERILQVAENHQTNFNDMTEFQLLGMRDWAIKFLGDSKLLQTDGNALDNERVWQRFFKLNMRNVQVATTCFLLVCGVFSILSLLTRAIVGDIRIGGESIEFDIFFIPAVVTVATFLTWIMINSVVLSLELIPHIRGKKTLSLKEINDFMDAIIKNFTDQNKAECLTEDTTQIIGQVSPASIEAFIESIRNMFSEYQVSFN